MDNNILNKEKEVIISSLFWKLMERFGTQGIQFLVQIILARLLLPEDFGTIALITVFINVANVFVQSSFNVALIQKKDANETDFSSVFYLSLLLATFLYVILYFTSPLISNFYDTPQISNIIRILSINLFLGAFNSIKNAIIARGMQFKKLFFSSLGAIVLSGIVGIIMAYSNYGVWALVTQQIINQLLITILLWFTIKWRPQLLFSLHRIKSLFSYGWKILISTLLDTLYMNLSNLIIGKLYSSEMLGYFSRGQQFPALIVSNINGTIQSVMLPVLSSQQDNKQRVKSMMRTSIVTSSFLIFPLMIGLAVIAKPLVVILLTDKWLPCVPILQMYCLIYALWPIHTANLQAINALGRSDIFLKLEITKKIVGLIILGITLFFGVYVIAFGGIITGLIATIINSYPNKTLLNYGYKEQCKDVMPSFFLSLVMGIIIYSTFLIGLPIWTTLIIQVFLGAISYVAMAHLFKVESFNYLLLTCKDLIKSRGKRS